MKKISNLLFNNLLLLMTWGILQREILDIFSVAAIILLIFILPGLGWLGIFIKAQRRDFIEQFFFVFLISTVTILAGSCLLVGLKLQNSFLAYFVYLAIVTNAGILLSGKNCGILGLLFSRVDRPKIIIILAFICIFIFGYFQSVYYIPALPDNTLTVQEAAYGLWHYLKPYTFSDDGYLTYYFAHPLLMNFYAAHAFFLTGHLSDIKYYYDYSQIVNRIYEDGPYVGEDFIVYTSEETSVKVKITEINGDRVVLDRPLPEIYLPPAYPRYADELFKEEDLFEINSYFYDGSILSQDKGGPLVIESRLADKRIITRRIYEQIRLRIFHDELYKKFYSSPHKLCSRIVNMFFVMATLIVMMAIMMQLGLSYQEALLLLVVYISLPEVNVFSFGGSRTAISSFCLITMIYFYWKQNARFSFLSGLVSGLTTQNLVLLPIAAMCNQLVFKRRQFPANSLLFGFFGGLLIYWIYAAGVDAKTFFVDHVQYHTINRVFHVDDLGYGGNYPNLVNYWKLFIAHVGWPFFFMSIFPLVFLFREKDSGLNIFAFWFLTGAVIFSLVDWKETKHLNLIVIPLVFGIVYLMRNLKEKKNLFSYFARLGIITVLFSITVCNLYGFASKNGHQMLKSIGIYSTINQQAVIPSEK